MKSNMTRRGALGMLLASASLIATGLSAPAFAQSTRLVIGTYGGDAQRHLEDGVIKPFLQPQGIAAVIDPAADGPRELKLQAERNLPRGSYDAVQGQAAVMYRLFQQGLIEPLDMSRIEGSDAVESAIKTTYAIPQSTTTRGILYNTEFVKEAPTAYADLWKPEFEGKIGLIDQHFLMALTAGALINGGSMSDLEPGKEKLLELKAKGVRIYPSNEAFGQALATGEIWAGIMIQSRAVMWSNAGSPIAFSYPAEGVIFDWWGFGIPKNSRNKDAAYALLNAVIKDKAIAHYAENMGTTPTSTTAGAATDSAHMAKVAIPDDVRERVLEIDEPYLLENFQALRGWWDREFKG